MTNFDLAHGAAVARRLPPCLLIPGLLHDVLEDEVVSPGDLALTIDYASFRTISDVTRGPKESYGEYIERLATGQNLDAKLVKIADLKTNLARMDDEHKSLRLRYEKALARLRGSF